MPLNNFTVYNPGDGVGMYNTLSRTLMSILHALQPDTMQNALTLDRAVRGIDRSLNDEIDQLAQRFKYIKEIFEISGFGTIFQMDDSVATSLAAFS